MTPERKRELSKLWYQKNKQHVAYIHKQYKIAHREHLKKTEQAYYLKNREKYIIRNTERRRADRLAAINAYGGPKCPKCGDTRLAVMTIHHINHNGAEHRRQLVNGKNSRGSRIFYWLRLNNYPPGFQVLCQNCNYLEYLEHFGYKPSPPKQRVMEKLGGKCIVCNKNDLRILTVHHINHNGAEHRRNLGSSRCGGLVFYYKILKSGNFSGLECRCLSCNYAAEEN